MIEHCLDSKGHFCFTTLIDDWQERYNSNPNLADYGCVCSIKEYTKHDDGRFTILVNGLYRTKVKEIPSEQLYRQSHTSPIEYIDDITNSAEDNALVRNFIKRFLLKQIQDASDETIDSIIDDMELGKFFNILCFQSRISVEKKIELLKENSLKEFFIQINRELDEN
jgi:Lon protease-like protein